MRVMVPLLMKADVVPVLSIAEYAKSRVGAISDSNSWKREPMGLRQKGNESEMTSEKKK